MSSGETDLDQMLRTLTVSVRPGTFTVVALGQDAQVPRLGDGVEVTLFEAEGTTVISTVERAEQSQWPVQFRAAWLTLDVHSSLEAVGLTAAFAKVLGEADISCNVIAGYYHDHLLVPVDRAEDALACLHSLRAGS